MLGELGLKPSDLSKDDVAGTLQNLGERMDKAKWGSAKRRLFNFSLFGRPGAVAAQMLLNSASHSKGNQIEQMTDDIRAQTTALDDAANKRENTLEGRLLKVTARWQTLWVTVGQAMLPNVENALDTVIAKITQWEASASSSADAAEAFKAIGLAIEGMAAGLNLVAPILKGVVDSLKAVVDLRDTWNQVGEGMSVEQYSRAADAAAIPAYGSVGVGETAGSVSSPFWDFFNPIDSGDAQRAIPRQMASMFFKEKAAKARQAALNSPALMDGESGMFDTPFFGQGQGPLVDPSTTKGNTEVLITLQAKDGTKASVSQIKQGAQDVRVKQTLSAQ